MDLKYEYKDFKKNGTIIFDWIVEYYNRDKDKLHATYEIAIFKRALDREVLRVLVVILRLKIEIEVEEGIVRMMYSIIQAHVYYKFVAYLSNVIKINLVNIDSGEFQHSSYLWWLIVDQHVEYFIGKGLKLALPIFIDRPTPIDIKILSMKKRNGNAYSFSDNFAYLALQILIGKFLPRLNKDTRNKL